MNDTDAANERDPAAQNAKQDLTVQVYVRPELLLEPVDSKIETLQTLEAEGVIDGLVLHYWPSKVELSADPPHSEAIDAYERFEMWADANDVEISPPFSVRTRSSEITGEERTVLSTPVVCLAIYEAGRLVGVYPHSDGDRTRSVGEAIAAIRTGQLPAKRPEPTAPAREPTAPAREPTAPARGGTNEASEPGALTDSPTGENQCSGPDCDGLLANVQGVLVCCECRQPATTVPEPTRRVLAGRRT